MLAHLKIRNFVLIDELDLALSPGFNVLTGETGTGKSLIASALDLLLGRRARGDLVRKGKKEAEIEGLFDISDEPSVKASLRRAGLPEDDELLVRRVIPASGRHRCYVNGGLASLSVLSGMAEGLARLMGQHEQLSLLVPAKQLDMLDQFGGHTGDLEAMRRFYDLAAAARNALQTLVDQEHDRMTRLDYLSFQVDEIDRLEPEADELDRLDKNIERMQNWEQLRNVTRNAALALYEADGSAFETVGKNARALQEATRYDEGLADVAAQLDEAAALLEDAARGLADYGRDVDLDPAGLSDLEDRREALRGLVRKHGTDLAGVLDLRRELTREIETLSQYEASRSQAESALQEANRRAQKQAAKLSGRRKRAGLKLAKEVTRQLTDLQFGQALFSVQLAPAPSGIGPSGLDSIEFTVALNPGEGAHPLREVASGGELSRLMLAVKRAIAGVGPVGTYVFDEVDAGIGGAVAASVGRKLRDVARHHQVICITHLPQIAGMADTHLKVTKEPSGGRTATRLAVLSDKERVDELARMLGGEKISKKTRAAARELIAT
jgi:DNA repair protein RecN (Recombination protein N)